MGFDDRYRLSAHAVITDESHRVLQLRATYGEKAWGLPGGAVDLGETLHETLLRECAEELGCVVTIRYLSGVYYHSSIEAHVAVFRCDLTVGASITLSSEHGEHRFFRVEDLSPVQRVRVNDCLDFDGLAQARRF